MKLPRRGFLHLTASAAALPLASSIAAAEPYPTRPVHLIVGFAAGQSIDIVARLMAQWLSERLGQQFVVENRQGAGGNIAAEAVVRAPADGYTLLVIGANFAINVALYEKLNYNLLRDIVPIGGIYRVIQVMEVNPSFPAATVPEFIAYARANPGKINFASAGSGSVAHVTGELFKMMTGINMQHVPYRGAPAALTDLLSGQVQVMFDNLPTSIDHVKAGRLRALGVTSTTRWPALPDVPTVADFVPGFETSAWAGLGAPKGTPSEIIELLNREINAGLADPKITAKIAAIGGVVLPGSSADFAKFIADETEKWTKVVKFSGARAE
jgi:tripartite-type tricarboxylate transporter receptor subunit TctC